MSITEPTDKIEPKLMVLDDGTTPMVDYWIDKSPASTPLRWETLRLRVPETMGPHLVLYNGMFLHKLLQRGDMLSPAEIYKHPYHWYNEHHKQGLYAVQSHNHLVVAYSGENPIPYKRLQNIGRLVPEFAPYDVYCLDNDQHRQWGTLQEGTVPHAAAIDFLDTWWANPDKHLAPRLVPLPRPASPDPAVQQIMDDEDQKIHNVLTGLDQDPIDHSIPCTMIRSDGSMTAHRPRRRQRPAPVHYALIPLYNKGTGYIDGGVWFQDEYMSILDLATGACHARFEHMDPDSCVQAINYIRTKLPRSGDGTYQEKSTAELKELARDMIAQRVFFSTQLARETDVIHMVFMTLIFIDVEGIGYYMDHQMEIFYEYMENAGPRSINGYPMFTSHRAMTVQEYDKLLGIYRKMRAALDAI